MSAQYTAKYSPTYAKIGRPVMIHIDGVHISYYLTSEDADELSRTLSRAIAETKKNELNTKKGVLND